MAGLTWCDRQLMANSGSKYRSVSGFQVRFLPVSIVFIFEFFTGLWFKIFFPPQNFSKIIPKISVIILELPEIFLEIFQNNFQDFSKLLDSQNFKN